ncbi:MAG TPA: C40 family peptidase, partial [Savagea sp.]
MKRIVYTILASLLIFMSVPEAASAKSADQLINIGKKYMGIKYRYGGTTPAGFDCSGYTQYVFREAGVSIPRTTGSQFGSGQAVAKSNLKTGDLVFFNTSGRGVSHVGIFIQGGKFIHASTSQGVTITALNDPYYWGKRYIGARRVKNFDAAPAVAAPVQKESPYITRGEVAKVLAEKLNL